MKRHRPISILIFVMAIVALNPAGARAAEAWQAPPEAAQVKNPVAPTKESIDRGKMLYLRYCMNCHGIDGKGDGPEAAGLDPKPADFTNAAKMNAQTDGALFWKLTTGKGKMKPYAEVSPTHTDKEKWDLINYIRTYAKKSTGAGTGDPQASREAQRLLTTYLGVTAALNAENLTSATKHAAKLGALADQGMTAGMTEKTKPRAEKLARDLKQGAKRLQAASSQAAARRAFAGVSKTVNDWLVLSQLHFDQALTVYACPRTLTGKKAIWLQESGPPLNPYGLRDIRRCTILRKIPAGHAADHPPAD